MIDTKARYTGIQSLLQEMQFNSACHFLALCSIAEEVNNLPIDFLQVVKLARSTNLIRKDFYVNDACALLRLMTNRQWSVRKEKTLPSVILDNEYTEAVWYNPRTKFTHFRRRGFDTLNNSITVKEGNIAEYRVYTCY